MCDSLNWVRASVLCTTLHENRPLPAYWCKTRITYKSPNCFWFGTQLQSCTSQTMLFFHAVSCLHEAWEVSRKSPYTTAQAPHLSPPWNQKLVWDLSTCQSADTLDVRQLWLFWRVHKSFTCIVLYFEPKQKSASSTHSAFSPLHLELEQAVSATPILAKQNCLKQSNRLDLHSHVQTDSEVLHSGKKSTGPNPTQIPQVSFPDSLPAHNPPEQLN